jgi:serine/threonine protein kinase
VSLAAAAATLFGLLLTALCTTSTRTTPRIVVLGEEPSIFSVDKSSTLKLWRRASSTRSIRMEIPNHPLESEEFYIKNQLVEDNQDTHCPYTADWQRSTSAKPTCNIQHEIGIHFGDTGLLHRLEPINSGAFKDVWKIFGENNPLPAVLKTTAYDYDFLPKYLNKYRRDALVMDETTASPYVLNMYCYCAYSAVVEAAQGTVRDWLEEFYPEDSQDRSSDELRYDPKHRPPPQQVLRAATMMAKGLEATHLFTESGLPTFAHADIKASQFLVTTTRDDLNHPILKLNDFNRYDFNRLQHNSLCYRNISSCFCSTWVRGRLLSAKDNKICPFYISTHHKGSTNRSPEEYARHGAQTDKIDVFSLGSTFYELLTGETPFADDGDYQKAVKKIIKGVEPSLPAALKQTTDPSLKALVSILHECRQLRPEDRPASQQVAHFLQKALDQVEQEEVASQKGEG